MSQTTEIARQSIESHDIEHYVRIGRALHGQAVRDAGRGSFRAPSRLLSRAVLLLRRIFATGSLRACNSAAKSS